MPRTRPVDALGTAAWYALFRHRSLMLLTVVYGAIGYFQYLFFYWMSYYFQTVLQLPERQSRFYAAIPPAGDGRGDAAGRLALGPAGAGPRHGGKPQGRPHGWACWPGRRS